MAKYHITAGKIREKWNLNSKESCDFKMPIIYPNNMNLILDCMRGCSQLRQSKVIESFFKEIFPDTKTEYIEIEGKYGKFQKLVVTL